MSARSLTSQYVELTPEERFRLIIAASARDDSIERDRLIGSAYQLHLTLHDYEPYSLAFQQVANLIYIELLEEAADFLGMLDRAEAAAALAVGDDVDCDDEEPLVETEGDSETEDQDIDEPSTG